MKLKRIFATVIILALALFHAAGCGKGNGSAFAKSGKLSIVTTIFPEYDWVKSVLGDKASDTEVTMLLNNGVDLHSYQPSVDDILKISTCDLFIYVGGESDFWVEDVLKQAVNKNMVVINLLESLGNKVKNEEITEGMEHEHDHDHGDHDHDEDHDHDHDHEHEEDEKDEHVWLSLSNAKDICEVICDALVKIDSANAETYKANTKVYTEKLTDLDNKYKEAVNAANKKTVVFADRFPFRYLVDDYNLEYFAAFSGCSAESEASFETVIFLANKIDELGLSAVLKIEGNNHKIAETVRDNTTSKNQEILVMDSMQSTTSDDVKKGANYLSIMEENLEVLKNALK